MTDDCQIGSWTVVRGRAIPWGRSAHGVEVDAWREQRNRVIHGLVKSSPGTSPEEVGAFTERSREAAEKGKILARAVQNWHQKKLRASRSASAV